MRCGLYTKGGGRRDLEAGARVTARKSIAALQGTAGWKQVRDRQQSNRGSKPEKH
jgi:hypothetical protein